jgi:hypothetical protein
MELCSFICWCAGTFSVADVQDILNLYVLFRELIVLMVSSLCRTSKQNCTFYPCSLCLSICSKLNVCRMCCCNSCDFAVTGSINRMLITCSYFICIIAITYVSLLSLMYHCCHLCIIAVTYVSLLSLMYHCCVCCRHVLSTNVCWKGTFCAFLCELLAGTWKWVPITPKMLIDFCFGEK